LIETAMTKTNEKVSATTLIGIGLATLAFAALLLYAGYRFALRDVCIRSDRYSPAALMTGIASVISIILFICGAARQKTRRNIFIAVGLSLVSLGVAGFAAFLILPISMAEMAADIRVSADNELHFNITEGFRVKSLYVEGPAGRWAIAAVDEQRPPLSQNIDSYTLGQTPPGYIEQPSSFKLTEPLPDGEYRVEANVMCAYRPARASFTIKQGRLQSQ
jgi:hypothetical protein